MSMGSGMGPVWRHMRTDRSVGEQKLHGDTVRRVLGFARPHRRPIGVFLGLTVVDAALVVVTPLLVKRIVDDGILQQDTRLVVLLALAAAGVAVLHTRLTLVMGRSSSRSGERLIFDRRATMVA